MRQEDTDADRMTPMKAQLTLALALFAAPLAAQSPLPSAPPTQLGLSPARLARIDSLFQRGIDSNHIAGGVALVIRHGKVGYLKAFGYADREHKRPMTPNTLYRIASQSKAITSVAAMILVEQGKLRLNDPVSRFIPSFAHDSVMLPADSGMVPAERAMTIRDLLTHTSGLSYGTEQRVAQRYRAAGLGPAAGYGWYFADKDEPICTTIDRLGSLPLVSQPGKAWVYGYSLDVLGCVIERVSGQPLDQFIRDHVTGPLRMNHTWFYPPASMADSLAVVYMPSDPGWCRRRRAAGVRATTSRGRGRASRVARDWSPPSATTAASCR